MQASSETAATRDDGFLPLPRIDARYLTYSRFLREFALPRQPCILTDVGGTWAAKENWSVEYLLAHGGIDESHKVHMAVGRANHAKEVATTVGKALRTVQATAISDANGNDDEPPSYLSAWDYVRGKSACLQEDFSVPRFFERAPRWLSSNVVLGNAATDMKWLYIGTRGSGSSTHVDTNLSSAWLWCAHGRKEWVCAHGGDHAVLTRGTGSAAYGYASGGSDDEDCESGSDDDDEPPLPDFFADDLFERWPQCRGARLYRGYQGAGEVCYNPTMCVHAVRNVGNARGEVILSLTHNFVDATNLAEVLSDATRSIRTELLPMAKALKPKSVLKTLAKSLHMNKEDLAIALRELPTIVTDARVEEVIACAAAGAEEDGASDGEGTPEAVATLLRATLEDRLKDVRPAFVAAATALREALQLEPPAASAPSDEIRGCGEDGVLEVA